jgi:thiamine biosynthesis lipoprotein
VIADLASVSFPALGTTALLCVGEATGLSAAHDELVRELTEIDAACSRFREDSELVRLNAAAGSGPVRVSRRLFEAVEVAVSAAASTHGLVDPTVGQTLRLAGYDRRFQRVKLRDGSSFRAGFSPVPGWPRIRLDPQGSTLELDEGVELDLGATAKALAADRSARAAAQASGVGVLVSLGGDIAVAGPVPDEGWPVRIADHHAAGLGEPGPTVTIAGGGLATSGTTVRRWQAGDVELHHIVDPRTGRPAVTPGGRFPSSVPPAWTRTSRAPPRSSSARRRRLGSVPAGSPRGSCASRARSSSSVAGRRIPREPATGRERP